MQLLYWGTSPDPSRSARFFIMNMKKYLFAIVALGMLAAYAYIMKLTSKDDPTVEMEQRAAGFPIRPVRDY